MGSEELNRVLDNHKKPLLGNKKWNSSIGLQIMCAETYASSILLSNQSYEL